MPKQLSGSLAAPVVLIMLIGWIYGFVIAQGFWQTLFCWIPFYSWYVVIEFFHIRYVL